MFRYTICNQADGEIFEKQCSALEKNIPNIRKSESLTDVDESQIQEYRLAGKKIKVVNSYYTNEVYVKSEIDLIPYFN